MIELTVKGPLDLWEKIAETVLKNVKEDTKAFEVNLGKRRISHLNYFVIYKWPGQFEAKALYWAVGYELHGNKMSHLWNSYIDDEDWYCFRERYKEKRDSSHYTLGFNFKRKPDGKGGCLSCFELVGGRNFTPFLVVHSKTAEFPKKFTADMRLISMMISDLEIPYIKVYWSSSALWYAHQFLKGIRTVFGNSYFQGLLGKKTAEELLEFMPGYVEPTQERIKNHYKELHFLEQDSGMKISEVTGEREKIKSS